MTILARSARALQDVGPGSLKRWRRLLELAGVHGALCGVDVCAQGHPPAPSLADLQLDRDAARLHTVDPDAHIAVPFAGQSCDALFFGPRVMHLDEASRDALIEEGRRVVRPGGHVMLVVMTEEETPPLQWPARWPARRVWLPGAPRGWWSNPVGERFEEVRHASFSRRLGVVLARRIEH